MPHFALGSPQSKRMEYELVNERAELEALSNSLSITTFRYVPQDIKDSADAEPYLNRLNSELLTRLQVGGEVFLSNAVLRGSSHCAPAL